MAATGRRVGRPVGVGPRRRLAGLGCVTEPYPRTNARLALERIHHGRATAPRAVGDLVAHQPRNPADPAADGVDAFGIRRMCRRELGDHRRGFRAPGQGVEQGLLEVPRQLGLSGRLAHPEVNSARVGTRRQPGQAAVRAAGSERCDRVGRASAGPADLRVSIAGGGSGSSRAPWYTAA